jgi:PilZ domain
MIGLSKDESRVFSDCCRQFDFQAVEIEQGARDRLQREKFEGVAVGLGDHGEETLESIRKSKSNQRVLIFAVCDQLRDAYPHARFGINATFERPLEKSTVLKLLKAARLLILNEFRRYLRIPIVLPVILETDTTKIKAASCELSGGGMSITVPATAGKSRSGDRVSVSFTLPDSPPSKMPAQVCWNKEAEKMIGVRFDETAPDRVQVKRWIDDFLGIR